MELHSSCPKVGQTHDFFEALELSALKIEGATVVYTFCTILLRLYMFDCLQVCCRLFL
ncbi:hypothetical protein Peur_047633 [Populus x canadensis]